MEKHLPKIEEIAEALTGDWVVEPYGGEWCVRLTRRDSEPQQSIYLAEHSYRNKGRFEVSDSYPRDLADHMPRNEYDNRQRKDITVSASRSAKAIARDIERRFMPGYLADLEAAVASKAKHDDWAGRLSRALDVAVAALPGAEIDNPRWQNEENPNKFSGKWGTASYSQRYSGRASADGEYSITVEGLHADDLLKIAAVLTELAQQ